MTMNDKTTPHDIAAERALIGGVLVQPEGWPFVSYVPASAFFRTAHRQIWDALTAMDADGTAVDLLTLRAELEKRGTLESVGGRSYLIELTDGVPRGVNIEAYADIVNKCAMRRAKIAAYEQLIQAEVSGDASLVDDMETQLALIAGARAASLPLDAQGQAQALLDELERERSGVNVTLGLPALDDVFGGIRQGEVLQIWARPGLGKTLVAGHMIVSMEEASHPCMAFSLEMSAGQFVRRLCRMGLGLTNWRLRTYGFSPDDYVEKFRMFTLDATPGLSIAQMHARIRQRRAAGYPVRCVLIDHLGLIGGDRSMTTYDRVSTQAREIKELAKRMEVAVILLVQVNREAGGDGSRELHLGAARDSGVIEEAADYIVAMRRLDRSTTLSHADRETYADVLFTKVLKHRNGSPPNREFAYRIDGQTLTLSEDLSLQPDAGGDIAGIAARAGGRR